MRLPKLLFLFFPGLMAACGPVIQLIDVDVKIPAEYPVPFDNRDIAVFNALYDTDGEYKTWNDSLLMNSVAEGFRNQLAANLSIVPDSIAVYNHFCDSIPSGTLEEREYIYSLSEQTGARTLVLIDSLKHSDFQYITSKVATISEYRPLYINSEWQMVFRFFDMDKDQFIARFAFKDTLYWNVLAKEQDSRLVDRKLRASLPETAAHLGAAVARLLQPQWETQERALFFFSGSAWYKALEHAFLFEWEEARNIWLKLTKETKNAKKIAFAAYNLAVACEIMGQIEVAKEWLNLSQQYLNIPEISLYRKMLDERKVQQRVIHLQWDPEL